MSNVAVFAVGLLVTLLVVGAISLLLWGAVMDGREDDIHRAELTPADPVGDVAGSRLAPGAA